MSDDDSSDRFQEILEEMDIDLESDLLSQSSEIDGVESEVLEVTRISGVDPSSESPADITRRLQLEDGVGVDLTVKKRLQCPECGYVAADDDDPDYPGECPGCGQRY